MMGDTMDIEHLEYYGSGYNLYGTYYFVRGGPIGSTLSWCMHLDTEERVYNNIAHFDGWPD